MSDVGRKTVPDKVRLNRERTVTKALAFPVCTGKSFFIENGMESTRWSVHRDHRAYLLRELEQTKRLSLRI